MAKESSKAPAQASAQGSKYSAEQVAELKAGIVGNLEKGQTHTKSAELAGIGYMTMYRWLKKDAEFEALVRATEKIAIKVIEDALYAKAAGGNTTAMIFYLCNRARKEWVSVNRLQGVNVPDGDGGNVHVTFEVKNGNGKADDDKGCKP